MLEVKYELVINSKNFVVLYSAYLVIFHAISGLGRTGVSFIV